MRCLADNRLAISSLAAAAAAAAAAAGFFHAPCATDVQEHAGTQTSLLSWLQA
jgi:hypothetical protein